MSLPPGRYSRVASTNRRIINRIALAVAGIVVLSLGAWIARGILIDPVHWKTEGYTVVDATKVDVAFQVSKPPTATVECEVEALNQAFGQVGVVKVQIGPTSESGSQHQTTVLTDQLAVTGLVKKCTLTSK